MFYPGKESAVSTGDQQDDNRKLELKVHSNVPQGGDAASHCISEDHIEETNPNSLDIPNSEELQTSYHYSTPRDRPQRATRKPACYSADDEHGLIVYALAVIQEIPEGIEPSIYSEAISCRNSSNWLMAM